MSETTFGQWLKRHRQARGWSQQALGDLTGKHRTHVNRMENGPGLPEPDTRAKLHEALGTSEDDLVAVGILERVESPVPGGDPVYIPAEHIRPGDRAAADARAVSEASPSYAPERHAGLRTSLDAYNLTERQIGALLAVLDAFDES